MAAPTSAEIIAALLEPNEFWSGLTITYSFPSATSAWPGYAATDEQSYPEYGGLGAAQMARFRIAIDAWDRLIPQSFAETNDLTAAGMIRVAFTDVDSYRDEDVSGFAYAPPTGGGAPMTWEGDIWLDFEMKDSAFADTSFAYFVFLHELGHALGLKHSFEDGAVLPAAFDHSGYTVMSYSDPAERYHYSIEQRSDGLYIVGRLVQPTTPMVFDILAIQNRYGADPATAAGATTYSWSQAAPIMQAIYDAGGIDTFDLSAHTRPSSVNLAPGASSSIAYFSAEAQIQALAAQYPNTSIASIRTAFDDNDAYTWSNNVGIAYSTVIENVLAGAGGDTVMGNHVANLIDGGAGDDYLRGMEGDDSLVGGAGFDDINGNTGNDTAAGGLGADWVVGGKDNDRLTGEAGNDIVYGNLGDDWCDGGDGDDIVRGGQDQDVLWGQAGNDWLSGDRGDDTITGGAGADIFHTFGEAGLDRVTDFNRAEGDRVMLDPGVTYTVSQQGADTVIEMGGGGRMVLVGVAQASLTGEWIFGA